MTLILLVLIGLCVGQAASADALADADRAWERRAEGARDARPQPGFILESIRGYEQVLERQPEHWEARWKLLRSLHFAGEFLARESDARREWFEKATRVSEAGIEGMARAAGSGERLDALPLPQVEERIEAASLPREDVARLYFWSAIDWGAWSQTVGLLSAVREGVADRLYRYTRIALELEPGYDEGGAYRLLGRLHAVLPRIPFLSGWVDRERALPLIEQAYALAPANPGNRYLLAITLLDLEPARRDEAERLLRQAASLTPRPELEIEDLEIRREARERLAALRS